MRLSLDANNNRHHKKKRLVTGALLLVAALLIGYGAFGFWQRHQVMHTSNTVPTSEIITYSTESPDETPPDKTCEAYQKNTQSFKQIIIPRIGVDACIQNVGIDQHGNVAVPNNIHTVGWFTESVVPGQKGVSLIDGHVLGRYNDAVFVDLNKLTAGDKISIINGSDQSVTFEVVEAKTYSVNDTADVMLEPLPDVESQLTLITCEGTYDSASQTYDERLVVRAQLVHE